MEHDTEDKKTLYTKENTNRRGPIENDSSPNYIKRANGAIP